MHTHLLLAACGAVGALMYSFPILLAALKAVPPGRFAWTTALFSVFLGAALAPIFVPNLGAKWPFLVQPEPYPLAVGVGLMVNPLTPIIVRRLTKFADSYQIGVSNDATR